MKLRELVGDVYYFIRDFAYIANQAPLQLYASALTFAPECSQVKSLFRYCMPRWLVMPPQVADIWEANSLVLEGHTDDIMGVTFSSCGKYLATCAYNDKSLRIWDSATGVCTLRLSTSKRVLVADTSFSHDNKFLAVAYLADDPSRADIGFSATIYDTETGNVIETYVSRELKLRAWWMTRLAFAPGLSNTLFFALLSEAVPDRLEVWRTNIASHTFEKAWGIPTGINRCEHFIVSASNSLVSCFSPKGRNIISWRLESGAYVSSHKIDLNDKPFGRFIDCRGSDLVYHSRSEACYTDDGRRLLRRDCLEKLNTQTGQVEFITYIEETWRPRAMSLKTGSMAYTNPYTRVVYVIDLLQCPKTDTLTRYTEPLEADVSVSQNGEMILLAYEDRVELRDVLGDLLFQSPEITDFPYVERAARASVSEDGSVVIARLDRKIHVWSVKSGKELPLPFMDSLCLPVVSHDGKSMALSSLATYESGHEHRANVRRKKNLVNQIILWDLENNQEVTIVDRNYMPSYPEPWMFFSKDDKTLHTDQGDLDLETGYWRTDNVHVLDKVTRSISDDYSWLQLNDEDVLWLPESYRPEDRYDRNFGKNTIAYACQDGRVVIMQCIDPCE